MGPHARAEHCLVVVFVNDMRKSGYYIIEVWRHLKPSAG
jgi:hypothetical protein